MPQPVVASGVEATMTWLQGNGDVRVNVLHFSRDGDLNAADAEALADELVDLWGATLKTVTTTGDTLANVKISDMAETPWPTWDFGYTLAGTEGTTGALPSQLAAVVSLRSTLAGRSGRGRIYTGGFTELSNDADGTINAGTIDTIKAWVDSILGFTVDTTSYDLCVYSRKLNVLSGVTTRSIDRRWDVQRRRANRRLS